MLNNAYNNQMGDCNSVCSLEDDPRAHLQQSEAILYNGERFIIPQGINFEKQTTFVKVEQAARAFCQKNNISLFHTPLITRIIAYRHEFVFQEIWNRISESEREQFMEDLNSVHHDLMDSFYYHFVLKKLNAREVVVHRKYVSTPKTTKESRISNKEKEELAKYGEDMLTHNKVAIVFMCAGSSSRFEGQDKFLHPFQVGAHTCTILDLLFLRLRRNVKGNTDVPIIVNCNEFNSTKIQKYLKEKQFFGFNPSKFRFPTTYSLAVFDQNGKYCVNQRLRLVKRPSGTAACAQSLLNLNISNFLQNEGVQYVYFSGMQNLLENPADPILLGMVLCEKRKIGAKCVSPIFETQNLPRYYNSSEKAQRIEVLSPEQQQSVNSELLQSLPVAINSMVFQLQFLRQIIADYNHNLFLAEKYHVIGKVEKVYNINIFKAEQRVCYSFEKDLRDIISCEENHVLYKVSRTREYAPICSKKERYCLQIALNYFGLRLQEELERQLKF